MPGRSKYRGVRGCLGSALLIALATVGVATTPDLGSDVPAAAAAAAPLPAQVGTTTFLETFDGTPTNPQPWNARDWDVFQTTRDQRAWVTPDPVNAHHAFHNCGDVAAGGNHVINTWPETVFKCNDHVMTSINGEPGYAAIYLSPPAMADFSRGSSTVSFDVSTFVSSARDWIDVIITPFADLISYPFDGEVDGSGMPRNALHIRQEGIDEWQIKLTRNGQTSLLGTMSIPFNGFGGPSRAVRTPLRIVVSTTSLTLSYPTVPSATLTVRYSALSWNQGAVQLGHHSYTPLKDCEANPQLICEANTWHWDNVRISPAVQFYQWQATPERTGPPIHDSNPRRLEFGKPTPAGSILSFAGSCGVQVRDSRTSPWRSVEIIQNIHVEHTQSYRVTVPAGLTGIEYRFVANGGYTVGYGCQITNPIIKALTVPPPAGAAPLLTWDRQSGNWAIRTMSNWTFSLRGSGVWTVGYEDVVVGDFDRDGVRDDYMLWNRRTGAWVIQSLTNYTPSFRASGSWARGYDQIIVGDFDGDARVNDVLLWDNDTGKWVVNSMSAFRPTFRHNGTFSRAYDTMVVGDFDDDGRLDDTFLWDVTSGQWVMHSYAAFRPTYRNGDRWSLGYDRAYAGDFNNDTRFDDLILWDEQSGRVVVFSWSAWKPLYRNAVNFSSTLDLATSADLDGNNRWNELFVFDSDARAWQVHRWLAFVPYLARAGTWTVGYDVALA